MWPYQHNDDPWLENSLFGANKFAKNTDIDKYKYCGFDIVFDVCRNFSSDGGGFGKNVLIFGADLISSVHVDNRKRDILILGKGPTQGIDNTVMTATKRISKKF